MGTQSTNKAVEDINLMLQRPKYPFLFKTNKKLEKIRRYYHFDWPTTPATTLITDFPNDTIVVHYKAGAEFFTHYRHNNCINTTGQRVWTRFAMSKYHYEQWGRGPGSTYYTSSTLNAMHDDVPQICNNMLNALTCLHIDLH